MSVINHNAIHGVTSAEESAVKQTPSVDDKGQLQSTILPSKGMLYIVLYSENINVRSTLEGVNGVNCLTYKVLFLLL